MHPETRSGSWQPPSYRHPGGSRTSAVNCWSLLPAVRLVFNQVISGEQARLCQPQLTLQPACSSWLLSPPWLFLLDKIYFYKIRDALGILFTLCSKGEQAESDKTGLSKPLRPTGEGNRGRQPSLSKPFIQAHQEETRKSMNYMSPVLQPMESSFPGFIHSSKNYLRWFYYVVTVWAPGRNRKKTDKNPACLHRGCFPRAGTAQGKPWTPCWV